MMTTTIARIDDQLMKKMMIWDTDFEEFDRHKSKKQIGRYKKVMHERVGS
jgi:hypothetical protein